MKLCLGVTLALSATAAPLRSVALLGTHRAESQVALSSDSQKPRHFGDTDCPCIGFDHIDGETTVTVEGQALEYPADLGARCEPWDDGRHPSCKSGAEPGLAAGWCAQAWCYVDPCNCKLPVLPKVSAYLPTATYKGKPIFYSYDTCGGKDMWAKRRPEVGQWGCRCIGFDSQQGSLEVQLGGGRKASYPAEIGGTCKAWDEENHPDCQGDDAPDWCKSKWCFVDPCECKLEDGMVPKISFYLPEASFTGKGLFFSYETCGDKDIWTKHNPKACVNQLSQSACDDHPRCGWTGNRCLGKELSENAECADDLAHIEAGAKPALLQHSPEPEMRSGAARGCVSLAAASALLLVAARAA